MARLSWKCAVAVAAFLACFSAIHIARGADPDVVRSLMGYVLVMVLVLAAGFADLKGRGRLAAAVLATALAVDFGLPLLVETRLPPFSVTVLSDPFFFVVTLAATVAAWFASRR